MKISSHKGFTLVEIMIVLVVMGILAAIASPNLRNYMAKRRLNGATQQIAMNLMRARSEAVTTNKKIIIYLPSNRHQYTFVTDNDNDETITGADTTGATGDIHPDYYDVTFSAASSGFNPIFRPNGSGMQGTINVSSSYAGLTSMRITITTAGRVKVY